MKFCQECGSPVLKIKRAVSCGGKGDILECQNKPACGQLYRQSTGGIRATPGGESFVKVEKGSIAAQIG